MTETSGPQIDFVLFRSVQMFRTQRSTQEITLHLLPIHSLMSFHVGEREERERERRGENVRGGIEVEMISEKRTEVGSKFQTLGEMLVGGILHLSRGP